MVHMKAKCLKLACGDEDVKELETYFKRIGDNCVLDVNVWDMNALEVSMWEISESIIWYYSACNIIDDIWVC